MTQEKVLQTPLEYEDWFEKLVDINTLESKYVDILADAYCCFHKQAKTKAVQTGMEVIYKDSYRDPYFLLRIIFETMDLKIKGSRLGYIKVLATRKLDRM